MIDGEIAAETRRSLESLGYLGKFTFSPRNGSFSRLAIQLSESDLVSAYQAAEELWQGYVSIFISVIFAYLVVAYLVGAKLTRSQVAIVTALYALFGISFLGLLAIVFGRMTEIGSGILAINPAWTGFAAAENSTHLPGLFVLYGPFVGAFIAGLLFMLQIRYRARIRVNKQPAE